MTRRIVVTGSASGIGAATAALLRSRGDAVIGVDLRDAEVVADLSTSEGRAAAVAAITGPVDAVVACAGTSVPGPLMVRVNYFGVTELIDGLRPLLAESTSPRVAVVGSISGTHPHDAALVDAFLAGDEALALARVAELLEGGKGSQIYPSSKFALARWARRTAVAPGWADAGIPVNVVAPGVVLTPMTDGLFDDPAMKQVMDSAVPMPLNGYADPEVIAEALAFLVSAGNTHITGQVLYVDGGAEVTLRG